MSADRPDPTKPILLVVNPAAGGGAGGAAAEAAARELAEAGVAARVLTASAPAEVRRLAREAALDGASVVAAVGGDGTLHEVGNGVLDARLAAPPVLGLVPVGTGNDYARMLGVHGFGPKDAARVLRTGPARPVDVIRLEGPETGPEHVLNNVGLAYLALATRRRDAWRHFGRLSYLLGGFSALLSYRADVLEVTVDGVTLSGRFLLIHVGVGAYCGSGIRFAPDRARLDEGALDCVVVLERTRLQALTDWGRIRLGQQKEDVAFLRGKRVRVVGPRNLELHADGEMRRVPLGVVELTLKAGALRAVHSR